MPLKSEATLFVIAHWPAARRSWPHGSRNWAPTIRRAARPVPRHARHGPAGLRALGYFPAGGGPAIACGVGREEPPTPVVAVAAHGDVPLAVQVMKLGARDFFLEPCWMSNSPPR